MAAQLVLSVLLILVTGSFATLFCGRRSALTSSIAVAATLLAALPGLWAAVSVLLSGQTHSLQLGWQIPGGPPSLVIDPLSAVFLVPIFILAPLCAIYGAAYLRDQNHLRALGPHWFFYLGLVTAMILVVTAAHAFLFLVAWELMTLSSFFLVAFDHRNPQVRGAAWLYLLAGHLGAALLLGFFLYTAEQAASLHFADFAVLAGLDPKHASFLFILALLGFGVKAGLFPLHVWLPEAHPAAPSHVSALMSAVMVKTGIYGIVRVLTWLPAAPAWWGLLLAAAGMIGALYGISLAALQTDIKRCLAYSTIENVGVILVGLGLGLYALALGVPLMATLGVAGALLHIWNHALFKGLLFLGAGSLVHATGTRNLSLMGGLLKRMPLSAVLLMGGSLAAATLPPLNGFISEWLMYLGLLQGAVQLTGAVALPPLLLAGLLAITGALALLVFVRMIGIALLGTPRSSHAADAHESGLALTLPPALLLGVCLLIGLFPAQAMRLLSAPLSMLLAGAAIVPEPAASVSGVGWAAMILILGLATCALLLNFVRRRRPCGAAQTWGCGFQRPNPRMTYSAEGFSELAHNHVLPGFVKPEVRRAVLTQVFSPSSELVQSTPDPALLRWFQPLFNALADRFWHLRRLQQGRLAIYLLYIFLTCGALMIWSLWVFRSGH